MFYKNKKSPFRPRCGLFFSVESELERFDSTRPREIKARGLREEEQKGGLGTGDPSVQTTIISHLSVEETLLAIYYLINPKAPRQKRTRAKHSQIKTLYGLFNLIKGFLKKGYKEYFPSNNLISKSTKQGERSVQQFFNGNEYPIFGCKTPRGNKSNLYELYQPTIEAFKFLEVHGLMQGFSADFEKWRRKFIDRFEKWILPKLDQGMTVQEIHNGKKLVNKLSTKSRLNVHPKKPLNVHPITLPSEEAITLEGIEEENDACAREAHWIFDFSQRIENRLKKVGINGADVYHFAYRYSPSHLNRALGEMELWKKRGMDFNFPVKIYQTCLNRTKSQKRI